MTEQVKMIVNFSREMEWFTFNYDRLKWLFKLFWRNGQRLLCHFVGKEKWRPFENETRKTAAKLHFRKEQSIAFNQRNCSIGLTNYFSCNISNSITHFENEITDTFRLKLLSLRCQRLFPCGMKSGAEIETLVSDLFGEGTYAYRWNRFS